VGTAAELGREVCLRHWRKPGIVLYYIGSLLIVCFASAAGERCE